MQSQSHWYLGSKQLPCANSARDAFAEALAVFKPKREELENFDKLKHLKNLQEVQHIVESAQSNYEQQDQTRKTKKWLSRLASRICFYGRIFDVMVNHHPEYVSLAWGAFKLLFIVCGYAHIESCANLSIDCSEIACRKSRKAYNPLGKGISSNR